MREKLKAKYPDMKLSELSKKMGEEWSNCDAKTKKKYEDLAAADKERYAKEMAA